VLFFTDLTEFILSDVIQFPLMALGLLFTVPQLLWPETMTRVAVGGWGFLQVDTFYNGLQTAPLWHLMGQAVSWKTSLIGLAVGYGLPCSFNWTYVKVRNLVVTRLAGGQPIENGLGMGDFKMLAWLGAFWGWGIMLGIFAGAVLVMGCIAIPMLLLRRGSAQTMLPLGFGLSLATPVMVFYGPMLWMAYLGTLR
jgi:prepilin signal peptidase PulO-like enzyme (type II secretory pathway)